VVLGRQAEGVVAHRVQDTASGAAAEVGHGVADRVRLEVPDVRLAGGVRKHLQHVGLRSLAGLPLGLVRDLPGALVGPDPLPLGLDQLRVVASLHAECEVNGVPAGRAAHRPRGCIL
jgi:hypothetical protein